MIVNMDCCDIIYVIEFEPFMGQDIEEYQAKFNDWYYEEVMISGYRVIRQKSTLHYTELDYLPVIDWLNETCPTCNARLVCKCKPGDEDPDKQYMCF